MSLQILVENPVCYACYRGSHRMCTGFRKTRRYHEKQPMQKCECPECEIKRN